jgi:hypothetical protein
MNERGEDCEGVLKMDDDEVDILPSLFCLYYTVKWEWQYIAYLAVELLWEKRERERERGDVGLVWWQQKESGIIKFNS